MSTECRSYRASYAREADIASSDNGWLHFRDFIAPDFLAAVAAAETIREDGERLLNVRSLEQLEPLTLVHG